MNISVFLINRCEELIQKAYSDIKSKYNGDLPIEETILLGVFRKIVEKADAVNVLTENKCGNVTDSLARELLESYWHLCYLLEKDTDFRTCSFYYFDKLDDAGNALKQFEYLESSGLDLSTEPNVIRDKELCKNMIEDLETNDLFKDIRDEIAKKKEKYVKWYSLKNNNNSIKKLAEYLGYEKEYDAPYGRFSREVHGLTGTQYIKMNNDEVLIMPLRNLEDKDEHSRESFCQYYLGLSVKKFCNYFKYEDEFTLLKNEMSHLIREDGYSKVLKSINDMIKNVSDSN